MLLFLETINRASLIDLSGFALKIRDSFIYVSKVSPAVKEIEHTRHEKGNPIP
jgi:hypothetical protein